MNYISPSIKKFIFIVSFGMMSLMANAQITFPDDVDDEGSPVPIDNLLYVGIAAGIYFGVKKVNSNGNKGIK